MNTEIILPDITGQTAAQEPDEAAQEFPAARPHVTIRARKGWKALDLVQVWQYRDLFLMLAIRDLKLRYKQTMLGVAWVVLQPVMAAGVFSFVFGSVAKLSSDGKPYFVLAFAGLLGWTFFAAVLTKTSGCLIGNSNLISKVFFPRLVLPLSTVASSLVDLAIAAVVMTVLLVSYHITPSPMVLLFPVWLAMLTAIAMGIGLCTAALTVSYRDVQYILPVFTGLLMYASPVAYSVNAVPEKWRWVYYLNPLTPPLDAIRSSILGNPFPAVQPLLISAGVAAVVLVAGMYSFKRMEKEFADVI